MEKELAETKAALAAAQSSSVAVNQPEAGSTESSAPVDNELQGKYDALVAEKEAWESVSFIVR